MYNSENSVVTWGPPTNYEITITYLAKYFGISEIGVYALFPVFANLHNTGIILDQVDSTIEVRPDIDFQFQIC